MEVRLSGPAQDIQRALIPSLCAAFFLATWTNAFSLGGIPLPLIFIAMALSLGVIGWLLSGNRAKPELSASDWAFMAFLGWSIIAAAISPNPKSVRYLLAYALSFAAMGIALRWLLVAQADRVRVLLAANAAGLLFVSIFCLVEFIGRYHLGVSVQDAIPRTVVANAVYFRFPRVYGFAEEPTYLAWHFNVLAPIAIDFVWRRQSLGLLSKALYTSTLFVTWVLTFSAAGYVFLAVGAAFAILLKLAKGGSAPLLGATNRRSILIGVATTALLAICQLGLLTASYGTQPAAVAARLGRDMSAAPVVGGVVQGYSQFMERWRESLPASQVRPAEPSAAEMGVDHGAPAGAPETAQVRPAEPSAPEAGVDNRAPAPAPPEITGGGPAPLSVTDPTYASGDSGVLDGMLRKLTLSETHGTPRLRRWSEHAALALDRPFFGWGPGFFSSRQEYSSLNLFVFVAVEQGLPGVMLLALGLLMAGMRIAGSAAPGASMLMMSYVAGILHFLTMTQHYHPALWLLLGVAAMLPSQLADSGR